MQGKYGPVPALPVAQVKKGAVGGKSSAWPQFFNFCIYWTHNDWPYLNLNSAGKECVSHTVHRMYVDTEVELV